jgi:hypothetical protein
MMMAPCLTSAASKEATTVVISQVVHACNALFKALLGDEPILQGGVQMDERESMAELTRAM